MNTEIISKLKKETESSAIHRVWLMSDLQQSDYNIAKECIETTIEDFKRLEINCDQIWNLGDTVQGKNLETLQKMVELQIDVLEPLGIPLRFTCGNHEFDPYYPQLGELTNKIECLTHAAFAAVPNWKTSESISDFYFIDTLGKFTVLFLCDHADPEGEWIASGGTIYGKVEKYPHSKSAYEQLKNEIALIDGPVFIAGHNSFSGGLRSSDMLDQILPLPDNVIAHFYGHAHIGDSVWAGAQCFRKLSHIDNQDIPQFDVAALENIRGDAIRSAFLEVYEDNSIGVFFREHNTQKWSDAYFISNKK